MDRKDSYTEVFLKAAGVSTTEKNIQDINEIYKDDYNYLNKYLND